ncbi:hypothetical protein [Kitasatospora sp. NPDC002040]|uniref:hypothetical protein n=1 Tax=Kitasatospora sp. NPDC002040 TaxID=3154661 RepID=UPI0033274415
MDSHRTPNLRLRALLDEAGWTGQQLASSVNAEGARSAITVRYDRTAVAHWLAGTRPRDPACELICRVLAGALGREIGLQEAGFAGASGPVEQAPAVVHPHERLRELMESSPGARRALHRLPYSPAPDLLASAGQPRAEDSRHRIGMAQVRAAEQMVALLADADEILGGERVRPALTTYLSTDIATHLAASAPPAVGRRFRQAAADLSYLAGFTSFDANLHGAAQAYFRIAAQLAADVDDRPRYAIALRQMSVQAHFLGDTRQALHLAQGAGREIDSLPPESAAFVIGQEALALATCGQRRHALEDLGRAERLLARSEGSGPVLGGYHQAAFAFQQAEVLAAAGDVPGACGALAASLRHRPASERRARMLTTSRLAGLQLGQGHLELACSTWDRFLDDYPHVSSARGDGALRELRARLRPYTREPAAQRLLTRAARLTQPSTGRPTAAPATVPPPRTPAASRPSPTTS